MMDKLRKDTLFLAGILIIVPLLLVWYLSISLSYPYYFLWDMDFTNALDTVQIQSILLPSHIIHPNFGTYLFLFFSEKIAYRLGAISILSLNDVTGSLNPLAAMAELTDFIRLHSPFLAVAIVVLLALALYSLAGKSRWGLFISLGILGTQESLAYQSSMARSELYSIFYWSGAALAMISAAKTASGPIRRWLLFLSGFLLGLSFLSKAQSFSYLLILLVLLFLIFSLFPGNQKKEVKSITKKGQLLRLSVSFINLLIFLFLSVASYSVVVPKGIPTWTSGFCITPLAAGLFLALLTLFLGQLILYLLNESTDSVKSIWFLNIISSGFITSFALYFLIYPDLSISLDYLLLNFKIIFFGKFTTFKTVGLSSYLSNFGSYWQYNPLLIMVNIFLNLLLVLGFKFRFIRITKNQLWLCLLISALVLANIIFGTRPMFRDIIWRETLLNFTNLFYFAILLTRLIGYRQIWLIVCSGLFITLFFVNCQHTYLTPKRIDTAYNYYGWRQDKFFKNVYAVERLYGEIMEKKYNKAAKSIAAEAAINHRKIKRVVNFVFKNQSITHRNIGVVSEGFSAWVTDLGWKISEAPPHLIGAILVDNSLLKTKKETYFVGEYIEKMAESSPKKIAVLTRPDLEIFLFVQADNIPNLIGAEIAQAPYRISLQKEGETIALQGLEIKNDCDIPLDKIGQKFFFVVRNIYKEGEDDRFE